MESWIYEWPKRSYNGLSPFQRRWLQACAVYPALRWPLTVFLGRALAQSEGRADPDLDQHVVLARLPWFREGVIPEVERRALVTDMDEATRQSVRQIFEGHLRSVSEDRKPQRDEIIADDVFTRFMMREAPTPQDRAIDEKLAQVYGSSSLLRIDARGLKAIIIALMVGLAAAAVAFFLTRGWTGQQQASVTIPIPQMVELPGGTFRMGSPVKEPGRDEDEGPQRDVTIAPFQIARTEVTRAQFRAFIDETGYAPETGCFLWDGEDVRISQSISWINPGFPQSADHPVTCVNWNDAKAYVAWLNTLVEGGGFRLPSEAEWEYAARAGNQESWYWSGIAGDGLSPEQCGYANGADVSLQRNGGGENWVYASCDDGSAFTSAVRSLLPNAFGLYDMQGNVAEWVEDCWVDNYSNAPTDGSARVESGCAQRVLRGGSWFVTPQYLRSALRGSNYPSIRNDNIGFRVARTL